MVLISILKHHHWQEENCNSMSLRMREDSMEGGWRVERCRRDSAHHVSACGAEVGVVHVRHPPRWVTSELHEVWHAFPAGLFCKC